MRRICVPLLLCMTVACQMPYGGPGGVIFGGRRPPPPATVDITAVEADLVEAVNDARADRDVSELAVNGALMPAARDHAAELASRHLLDHASIQPGRETLSERLSAADAPAWSVAGENLIQLPFTTTNVSRESVLGWLESPTHRTQMLDANYTHTGVGIVRDAHGDWFIVQLFIRRR
jgi:uncharacterized protein YkwD